jgi:HEAT repeat protein
MAISFQCSGCSASYSVKDELGGKKSRCKKCQTILTIPNAAPPEPENFFDGLEGLSQGDPETVVPEPRFIAEPAPTRRGKRSAPPAAPTFASEPAPIDRGSGAFYAPRRQSMSLDDPSLNRMTMVMLAFFIVLTVIGGVLFYVFYDAPREVVSWTIIPAVILAVFAYFFAMTAGTWLGVRWTYRMFGMPARPKLYLRAAGANLSIYLAALAMNIPAGLLIYFLQATGLPPVLGGIVSLVLSIVFIRFVFWAYNRYFDTTSGQTLCAVLLSALLVTLISVPAALLSMNLLMSAFPTSEEIAAAHKKKTDTQIAAIGDSSRTPATPAAVQPSINTDEPSIAAVETEVRYARSRVDLPAATRESTGAYFRSARDSVDETRRKYPNHSKLAALEAQMKELAIRHAALPSETSGDPSLFTDAAAPEVWQAAGAAPQRAEGSFGRFNLVPPRNTILDVEGLAADPPTLRWRVPESQAGLTLSSVSATNPKQRRPWVTTDAIASTDTRKLFVLTSDAPAEPVAGRIGDLIAYRAELKTRKGPVTAIALRDDDRWLCARIEGDLSPAQLKLFEDTVRTLRRRTAVETAAEAVTIEALVTNFARSNHPGGEAVDDRLRTDPAVEAAVLSALEANPDRQARSHLLQLLFRVRQPTEKSLPMRWKIAYEDMPFRSVARRSLLRTDPTNASAATFAIEDLYSGKEEFITGALSMLATAPVDEARRAEVDAALAAAMSSPTFPFSHAYLSAACKRWYGAKVLACMTAQLASESSVGNKKAAITVLGNTGDARHTAMICRWISKEPETVVPAIVQIGPAAEDEVIKLLSDKDTTTRLNATRILQQIGTSKSLQPLGVLAKDAQDRVCQPVAQGAISDIRKRTGNMPK